MGKEGQVCSRRIELSSGNQPRARGDAPQTTTDRSAAVDGREGTSVAPPQDVNLKWLRRHWTTLLLAGVPAAGALEFLAPERQTEIFVASVVAIVPLAVYMGHATDELSSRLGGGLGGLLNATFGNAAELIIGVLALRHGLTDLVKASLTGSIIGNVLLVFGLSAFVGGLRHPVQRFNRTAAGPGTTMLLLSAVGLTVPAVFHALSHSGSREPELKLDTEIAIVLLLTYCASLLFTLETHRDLYSVPEGGHSSGGSVWPAVRMLVAATAGVAWMSELLVGAVSDAARALGMSNVFVGVVVVAVIGNAAEHFSAVLMAARDKMDTAISIAVGSSTQI